MSTTVRSVLIVNIENDKAESFGLFPPMYGTLEPRLRAERFFEVELIDSVELLQMRCVELNPKQTALIFVNELATENEIVASILKHFVNGGGLAIFCCVFVQFAKAEYQERLFSMLGLTWKVPTRVTGPDGVRTFTISSVGRVILDDFEEPFTVKSHMLYNVPAHQKLYIVEPRAQNVHVSDVHDTSATVATYGRFGKGAVSYIGNHNLEDGFIRLIVSLISSL